MAGELRLPIRFREKAARDGRSFSPFDENKKCDGQTQKNIIEKGLPKKRLRTVRQSCYSYLGRRCPPFVCYIIIVTVDTLLFYGEKKCALLIEILLFNGARTGME